MNLLRFGSSEVHPIVMNSSLAAMVAKWPKKQACPLFLPFFSRVNLEQRTVRLHDMNSTNPGPASPMPSQRIIMTMVSSSCASKTAIKVMAKVNSGVAGLSKVNGVRSADKFSKLTSAMRVVNYPGELSSLSSSRCHSQQRIIGPWMFWVASLHFLFDLVIGSAPKTGQILSDLQWSACRR